MALDITVAGESLSLLSERAAFWPRAATLLVADAHWGKAATFRAAGVPVPGGPTATGLDRLADLIKRHAARRLVLLGDLFHARTSFALGTMAAIVSWRERVSKCEIVLVRGNHDRRAGHPPPELRIECISGSFLKPPFAFAHYPTETPGLYTFAGHIHPSVTLAGPGRQRLRLPCFVFGERVGILPAFGEFTGTATTTRRSGDRVFVIADGDVIDASAAA